MYINIFKILIFNPLHKDKNVDYLYYYISSFIDTKIKGSFKYNGVSLQN